MPLTVAGPRRLGSLEKDVINFVFDHTIDPDELWITIPENIIYPNDWGSGAYQAPDLIKISRAAHLHTDDLNWHSTIENTDWTNINNFEYVGRLVHEACHHWQRIHDRYNNAGTDYTFNGQMLANLDFANKEQHASAAQIYLIVKWQLERGIQLVNLTDGTAYGIQNIGPMNRMLRIELIPLDDDNNRIVTQGVANSIVSDFDAYLEELRGV